MSLISLNFLRRLNFPAQRVTAAVPALATGARLTPAAAQYRRSNKYFSSSTVTGASSGRIGVGVTVTILRRSPVDSSFSSQLEVLLVQRQKFPFVGFWSLPGGSVNLGESFNSAAVREVREECGIEIEPFEPFYATEVILTHKQIKKIENAAAEPPKSNSQTLPSGDDNVLEESVSALNPVDDLRCHYSLIHLLSHEISSATAERIRAGSDATACRWFRVSELEEFSKLSVDAAVRPGRIRVVPQLFDVVKRGEMWFNLLTEEE